LLIGAPLGLSSETIAGIAILGGGDLMASIRRKGRHWQVVHSVYDANGRRRQNCSTFVSQAEAKQHRAKIELLEQRHVGTVKLALGDFLEGWLVEKQLELEPTTIAGYRRWVGHIRRSPVARLPIDRITARELEQLYRFLLDTPSGRGKPLAPFSVRHCHVLLENAFNDAVRHRRIDANPAAVAKAPRGQAPQRAIPDAVQVGALLDEFAAHNPPMVDLALLIIGTGMRRSEVLGLRFADLDWSDRRLTISQVVVEHDGNWSVRQGTKSPAGYRTISVDRVVLEALRRQQTRVAEWRLKLGRFWQDHDLVFPDPKTGKPCAPATITRAFTRAAQRAQWPQHTSPVHGLRHAAASLALAGGIDLAVISGRLGHSSAAVTARIYLHSDVERDRAAAEVMSAILRRQK
jgi:integrase